jgi:hypothetical protein
VRFLILAWVQKVKWQIWWQIVYERWDYDIKRKRLRGHKSLLKRFFNGRNDNI